LAQGTLAPFDRAPVEAGDRTGRYAEDHKPILLDLDDSHG
jgi:hypothetical protein